MARKLILHAGWHKTGSTAIQQWCARNAAALDAHGVRYPVDSSLIWDGHHRIPWGLGVAHPHADPDFNAAAWLRRALRDAPDVLLLSSEDFEFIPERGIGTIRTVAEGIELQVIIFIRNVVDYLVSDYQQNVRMDDSRYPHDIYRFAFQYNLHARMDYFGLLQKWAAGLGEEAVTLLQYDTAGQSVVQTFRQATGLAGIETQDDSGRANPSLKAVSLRALQELNRRGAIPERAAIIKRLYDLEEPEDSRFSPLEPEMADAFIARIGHRIRRVGERFKVDVAPLLTNPVTGKDFVDHSDWRARLEAVEREFGLTRPA